MTDKNEMMIPDEVIMSKIYLRITGTNGVEAKKIFRQEVC